MPLQYNLVISGEAHANETKRRVEMRPKKRLGRAMSLCHVWSHSQCFSLFLLTHHLHLNAWQQAAEERCGNKTAELWLCESDQQKKKEKEKRGGLKTEGKRKSYFGQRRFGWPDFLGRYLWREQENYFLVSPSSEISPVAYCCSLLLMWMSDHVFSCQRDL